MDIGKSLSFVFDDERWIAKLAVAGGVLLLGIVGMIVIVGPFIASALLMGYSIAVARNVMRGVAHPLPEWDEWGSLLVDGIKQLFVSFVWSIPLLIVMAPIIVVSVLADGSEEAGGVVALAAMCVSCLAVAYGILLVLVMPVWLVRLAETGSVADAIRPGRVLPFVRDHLGQVIIALIVTLVAQIVAGFGWLICGVGWLVTVPWSYMVQGHLAGQLGRLAGAEPGGVPAGGWTPPPSAYPPADVGGDDMPAVLPDDRAMVDEVQTRIDAVSEDWADQTVRLDQLDTREVAPDVAPVVAPAPPNLPPEVDPWAPDSPAIPDSVPPDVPPEPDPWAPTVQQVPDSGPPDVPPEPESPAPPEDSPAS